MNNNWTNAARKTCRGKSMLTQSAIDCSVRARGINNSR